LKCYGYASGTDQLLELSEVSIRANSRDLRRLAAFLIECAEGIDAHEEDWEHAHLGDSAHRVAEAGTDLVVEVSG